MRQATLYFYRSSLRPSVSPGNQPALSVVGTPLRYLRDDDYLLSAAPAKAVVLFGNENQPRNLSTFCRIGKRA